MTARAGTAHLAVRRQIGSASPMADVGGGLEAARRKQQCDGWINRKSGVNAPTVLTDATLVYNLRADERVIITGIWYGIDTAASDAELELGWTTQASGAGAFTAITPILTHFTLQSLEQHLVKHEVFGTPKVLSYADGARSVTFRVLASGALVEVTVGYEGWIEKEN